MMKNNRDKALLYVTLTILSFMVISAIIGGWPSSNVSSNATEGVKLAVVAYYEKMPENSYKIPESELKKLVDLKDTNIYILDIRENKDFVKGHISGAQNIPFKEVGKSLEKLPKDKQIIVYCYTGQTGGQTTSLLNVMGFKAKSLNGGMNNGWTKSGYPVISED